MKRLQPFWLAMALLTTLPVGRLIRPPVTPEQQGRSVACYPLVGLLLGGLLALVGWLPVQAPAPVGAILLLVVWVALTGALHLDGLADCSDAWAAGHADPERILSVMKDPACGPVAVAVLVLVLLVKLGVLMALGVAAVGLWVAAAVLGRCAAALLMVTTKYRRSGGIAVDQSTNVPVAPTVIIVAALSLLLLMLLPLWAWVLSVLAAGVCVLAWRVFWIRRIGGYTGDTVGGLIECIEVVVLVIGALVL